jgi:cobalt/nickel transport system permease protein
VHIPDGFIGPAVAAGTGVLAAGAVAAALRAGREQLDDRQVPLVGVTSAFVFAVQMLNFPVGLGTSGHLIGGALAAILLGPWMATLVLAVVLLVQALGFADGGITALGANITLMGLIAGTGGHYLFRALARSLPRTQGGFLAATAVTAWLSVVIASVVCSLFITVGGTFGSSELVPVLVSMVGLHALIGIGEAVITVAAVAAVIATRPDLAANADLLPPRTTRTVTA